MRRFRRFNIPKHLRKPIGVILNEITKPPQRRNKTDVYWRGVCDGVELVRKRAKDKGVSLDEPFIEKSVEATFIVVGGNND